MLACLNERGGRLYLLGAKPGVAEEAGRRLVERYPGIILCGTQDGYFRDEEAVLLKVAAARPGNGHQSRLNFRPAQHVGGHQGLRFLKAGGQQNIYHRFEARAIKIWVRSPGWSGWFGRPLAVEYG